MSQNERIYYLTSQLTAQRLTASECAELDTLLSRNDADSNIIRDLLDAYYADFAPKQTINGQSPEWSVIPRAIVSLDKNETTVALAAKRVYFLKQTWFRYAAAIVLFIGLATATYYWNVQENTKNISIRPDPAEKNDVLPGSNKAILTLANGEQIPLDSTPNALLQGKGITNDHALITYSGKAQASGMNTLTTPIGGQYKIRLSEGTMVWLNAASSITYPTSFTGETRTVSITGEAYFEVTRNKEKPFIVRMVKEQVEVLGTSFNVNAYSNEPAAKTSLLEGSVKISNTILKPGQAYANGKVILTDVQQDIAWKNGAFNFSSTNLEAAMRQIERWYGVQVVFKGKIPTITLKGKLPREFTLQQVLAAFADYGLRYNLEGKQLIISP